MELPAAAADTIQAKDLWMTDLDGEFFASPIVHDGLIYSVNKKGLFYILDAATGKILHAWETNQVRSHMIVTTPDESTRAAGRSSTSMTLAIFGANHMTSTMVNSTSPASVRMKRARCIWSTKWCRMTN